MVIGLVSYQRLLKLAEGKGLRDILEELEPDIMADKESRRRTPRPPAPAGGISIRAAARKYGIADITIRRWIKKGFVSVIPSESKYEKFVKEARIAELAAAYHSNPGRGTWAVKNYILKERSS